MLIPDQDAPLIKTWIVKRLANNSDADADVLADYVLALLVRHDEDDKSHREHFRKELSDFLGDDASRFTDEVLQVVKHRSYLPGAPPPPPLMLPNPPVVVPPAAPFTSFHPDMPLTASYNPRQPAALPQPPPQPSFPRGNSRKRKNNDHADDDDVEIITERRDPHYPPPSKQPRRGGGFGRLGGRNADPFGSGNYQGAPPMFTMPPGPDPFGSFPPFPAPQFDLNSIRDNIRMLQSMLPNDMNMTTSPNPGNRKSTRRGKRPCRNMERKGSCPRGRNCPFDHPEPLYLPPFIPPVNLEEYDPNHATLPLPAFDHLPQPTMQRTSQSNLQLTPSANDGDSRTKRIKGRAPYAATGPVTDKSKTTLVVQNIPKENFDMQQVSNYFSQFGPIAEVRMQNQNYTALIKFETWEAAHAAWSSPKVIFDNRFVKVFWYKEDTPGETTPGGKPLSRVENGHANGKSPSMAVAAAEPDFDMEDFTRKQAEAQRIHEEKLRKRQEIERERSRLEALDKELRSRQEKLKQQLREKLKANGIEEDDSLSSNGINSETPNKNSNPQTEALRAQLAALEQEATQLGLDPEDGQFDASSFSSRGRGRGRGIRGWGSSIPRGAYHYRGGAGGIEARHAAYAAYSLDNRPKIVALSGADFTIPENDENLRQYLFTIGEFQDVHATPLLTHVVFKDRKTAEKFEFGVSASNSIPGVKGDIEAAWSRTAPDALKAADGDVVMARTHDGDQSKEKDEVLDDGDDLEEGEVDDVDQRDHGDMDYEAGEW